jgi:hypothetical protein
MEMIGGKGPEEGGKGLQAKFIRATNIVRGDDNVGSKGSSLIAK